MNATFTAGVDSKGNPIIWLLDANGDWWCLSDESGPWPTDQVRIYWPALVATIVPQNGKDSK